MPEIVSLQALRDHQGDEVAVSGWRSITQADIDASLMRPAIANGSASTAPVPGPSHSDRPSPTDS
jgi:hypothetical protein